MHVLCHTHTFIAFHLVPLTNSSLSLLVHFSDVSSLRLFFFSLRVDLILFLCLTSRSQVCFCYGNIYFVALFMYLGFHCICLRLYQWDLWGCHLCTCIHTFVLSIKSIAEQRTQLQRMYVDWIRCLQDLGCESTHGHGRKAVLCLFLAFETHCSFKTENKI